MSELYSLLETIAGGQADCPLSRHVAVIEGISRLALITRCTGVSGIAHQVVPEKVE
jgi:hypothetical protein